MVESVIGVDTLVVSTTLTVVRIGSNVGDKIADGTPTAIVIDGGPGVRAGTVEGIAVGGTNGDPS